MPSFTAEKEDTKLTRPYDAYLPSNVSQSYQEL
jgi:hypothetical protein